MTWLDRYGQRLRIDKARPHIPAGSRVLDVGCGDGALFQALGSSISAGVGIDPDAPNSNNGRIRFITGFYPDDFPEDGTPFDVVVGLAVLEHLSPDQQAAFAAACHRHLRPGGRVVLTVPSPAVDPILHVVQRLHLGDQDTMHLEEHHGFKAAQTVPLFEAAGFRLMLRRSFELFLNNLFVFTKPAQG